MENSLKDFSSLIKNGVLSVADCGIYPDKIIDNEILRSAAKTASDADAQITVVFPKGTYYIQADADRPCGIDFEDLKISGVTFDGNGSTIIFKDNFKGGFGFVGCQHIYFKNFYLKYESVPWVQGTITDIDKDTQTMTLELDDDYTIFDDPRFDENINSGTRYGIVRDPKDPRALKSDVLYYFFLKSQSKIAHRKYNVQLADSTPLLGSEIFVGDRVVINNRWTHLMSMFNVIDAGYITFENITIYSCACTGIVGRQLVGPLNLKNFSIDFPENSNQWVTATADGVHIQSGTHPVTIEDSYFDGLMDDGVNFYQLRSKISKVLSPNSILLDLDGALLPRVGETVDIFDEPKLNCIAAVKVKKVEDVEGIFPNMTAKITFETDVPNMKGATETEQGNFVFVRGRVCPGSVIKNTTFCNSRGRGLVLCSSDTVVENCKFYGLSNHAIHGWYGYNEGFGIDGLKLINNEFDNIGFYEREANSPTSGVISIRLDSGNCLQHGISRIHKNLVIKNNKIKDFCGLAINLANCDNVIVEDNEITLNDTKPQYTKYGGIEISSSKDVTVKNNKLLNLKHCEWAPFVVEKNENLLYDNNVYSECGKEQKINPQEK